MPNPNNSKVRAAQILLTERDRWLAEQITRRAATMGVRLSGPTAVHRAGLCALSDSPDDVFYSAVRSTSDRPTIDELTDRFEQWCAVLAVRVRAHSADLEWAYQGNRHRQQAGSFFHELRLAHATMTPDGRVLLAGTEANLQPLSPGQRMQVMKAMFPGGLAQIVSMDPAGADLAAEAIAAWLLKDEPRMDAARAALRAHDAQPLV